ncbi:MAG: mannonate dehydratase [Clostridiales bacterium]|jgi:mannonate dehydratase|nr:mannonate dehydratase [Clostridiales bacterium]
MKMTFRWFGEADDSVTLEQIRQIPACTGLMGVISTYAAGEVWERDAIHSYVEGVRKFGLEVEVIESVNVHEDIKLGLPSRDAYIENYRQTIRNLSSHGVKAIVYNFMPVFDWLRTDLAHPVGDGSNALYYDDKDLEGLTPLMLVKQVEAGSNGFTLPGWEPERLSELEEVLEKYKKIDKEKLLEHYKYFLEGIIPTCEECGVKMAVHPDDPAWPVFGIPRLAHSKEDFDKIIGLVDSPANGLCLCTGSLGSNPANDLPSIIRHFGMKGRIVCAHVRNVKHLGDKRFRESSHLSSDGDLDMYEIMKALFESGFDGWIRPDHGRMLWGERARPGYGLYDRALGIAYLNGLLEAIKKQAKQRFRRILLSSIS